MAIAIQLPAQTELRNPYTSPADVAAGAKTFRSHCAACHGLNGQGGRGPNLTTGVFYHGATDSGLLNTISNGVPGTEMPGLFYSPDRVWQVVAYIRSINRSDLSGQAGDPGPGAKLFQTLGCNGCHRVRGEGGRLGPDLSTIGMTRSPKHLREAILDPNADVREGYWIVNATSKDGKQISGFLMNEDTYSLQLLDFEERLRSIPKDTLTSFKVDKTSKMPSYKGKISEQDLDQLVSYLSSLRPNPERSEGVTQ